MVHILPNSLSLVIVSAMFLVPTFILTEAFFSFIGVGIRPPTVSWGSVIRNGYDFIYAVPQEVWIPTINISLLTLAFTFLGDGLSDAIDPKTG